MYLHILMAIDSDVVDREIMHTVQVGALICLTRLLFKVDEDRSAVSERYITVILPL